MIEINNTVSRTGPLRNDEWWYILSCSSPIAIRAASIVDKNLNEIVNQYKVWLALENKDLSLKHFYPSSPTKCDTIKIFDTEIIDKLKKQDISIGKKVAELKLYLDTKKFPSGDHLLHYFADSSNDSSAPILEILLKLGPNLNIIDDNCLPTALFQACGTCTDPNITTMTLLIEAGADFRILNPDNRTCFKVRSLWTCIAGKKITCLENYAKETWKTLGREKIPIPTREFTLQRPKRLKLSDEDLRG